LLQEWVQVGQPISGVEQGALICGAKIEAARDSKKVLNNERYCLQLVLQNTAQCKSSCCTANSALPKLSVEASTLSEQAACSLIADAVRQLQDTVRTQSSYGKEGHTHSVEAYATLHPAV
jgi:hypothetical protein